MFDLKGIDHVVLRVSEVQQCLEFYQTVLGCSLDQSHPDVGLYQLRAGDCIIDLLDVSGPIGSEGGPGPGVDGHNLDHFCLRIEPFGEQELREHFACHGVDAGAVLNNWGGDGRGPSMYIHDPAGNTVEIKGPPTHRYDAAIGFIPE